MKVRHIHLICFLLSVLLLGCQEHSSKKVTIATAANMQFAMKALTAKFHEESGIDCEVIVSSSGKLTAQIKEGAPYDIFVSADEKYPENLAKNGFTAQKPQIYAFGNLVLWSLKTDLKPTIIALSDPKIAHIALANPNTAPYGLAAIETLKNSNLYDQVENKLVFGESISQTNQFIISRAAEVGFTAKSVVLSPAMKNKGSWSEIDSSLYSPIAQAAVLLKSATNNSEAKQFYEFLFSLKAKTILENFGYLVPEK